MKTIFAAIIFCSAAIFGGPAAAEGYHVLYGTKLGQSLGLIKKSLGEPYKTFTFEDGWTAHAYKKGDHAVIFETSAERPDIVISIQIEGRANPEGMGLDGVNLGSDAKAAIDKFGTPSNRLAAQDGVTHQPVPNTFINFYGHNFSFEEKDGKVTSIKVQYDADDKTADEIDLKQFIGYAKEKNYFRLAESISSAMTLRGKPAVQGPILDQIRADTPLHAFLFGKNGVSTLSEKNIADTNLRVIGEDKKAKLPASSGTVYKLKNHKLKELYFVRAFDGVVLFDVK